jgi:ADP-ribose pyrophosphatase
VTAGFSVTGEEELFRGRVVSLVRVGVEAPDGSAFEREVVRHPGAACMVPVLDDGTVLLVRQYRAPVDEELLELPAGLLDVPGESPAECAARELEEEAGHRAGVVEHLATYYATPGGSDEVVHVFLGTDLTATQVAPGRHEEAHLRVERVPLADTGAMIADGRIANAAAVVGLLLAREVLARRP